MEYLGDQAKALVEAGHNVFAAIDLRSLEGGKWGERKSIGGVNI